jgi:hypothetical protein
MDINSWHALPPDGAGCDSNCQRVDGALGFGAVALSVSDISAEFDFGAQINWHGNN